MRKCARKNLKENEKKPFLLLFFKNCALWKYDKREKCNQIEKKENIVVYFSKTITKWLIKENKKEN